MGAHDMLVKQMTVGALKNVPKVINGHHRFDAGMLSELSRNVAYNLLIRYGGLGGGLGEIRELADAVIDGETNDSLSTRLQAFHAAAFAALDAAIDQLARAEVISVTETERTFVIVTSEYQQPNGFAEFEDVWRPWVTPDTSDRRCARGGQTARYMMGE